MKSSTLIRAAAAVLALAAAGGQAQTTAPQLNPPAARISDPSIAADHQIFESMQARLRAINAAGRPLRDAALAKAQCWLDVSFHEYTRNDRGAFPQDALGEVDRLARAMEAAGSGGAVPAAAETPLISGAERLRPDLWARSQALRSHTGWRCAEAKAACAEVELVHAGHEQVQLQWRHAKPYVQIAEDLLGEAQTLAERCDLLPAPPPPPVAVVVPPPPPPPPVPAPPLPLQELQASVVFNFNRDGAADMRAFSVAQLEALVAQVRSSGRVAQRVQLVGHADRLNGTGQGDYNQRLSERRAATVRDALLRLGLPGMASAEVSVAAAGDSSPVMSCAGNQASAAELQECLLPNRRVDVRVITLPVR